MTRSALLAAAFVLAAHPLVAQPAPAGLPPALIVFFPDWSGALDDAANRVIRDAATAAAARPAARITVTAYADSSGSKEANVALTELRAIRVRDGLVADGIAPARIAIVARGAQQVAGVSARRAEIVIAAPR